MIGKRTKKIMACLLAVTMFSVPGYAVGKKHIIPYDKLDLEKKPQDGFEYVYVGDGELSQFWAASMYTTPGQSQDEDPIIVGGKSLYSRNKKALAAPNRANLKIDGIYLDGNYFPASDIIPENPTALRAKYDSVQNFLLKNQATKELVTVYCADLGTPIADSASYNVVNLEDATYYNTEQASKIRAIAMNGYWGTDDSFERVKDMMAKSGKFTEEEIKSLTHGVALTATQYAIWTFSNVMDDIEFVNIHYWYDNKIQADTPEDEQPYVKLLFKLYEHMIALDPVSVDEMNTSNTIINNKNILKDVDIEVVDKDVNHKNNMDSDTDNDAFITNVTFDMQVTPNEVKGDNLVANVVDSNGNIFAKGRIVGELQEGEVKLRDNGDGKYTFQDVTLIENDEVTYTVTIEGVQNIERSVYLYTPADREDSQTLVGYGEGEHKVDVSSSVNVKFNVPELSFKSGTASNISFMLIDANGDVEFINKIDIEDETSVIIPTEEGKTSAVFIKQAQSGMLWVAEEVDEGIVDKLIKCVKKNNPSYKGHDSVAFGGGEHNLTYTNNKNKKNKKTVTYKFDNAKVIVETN